MSGSPPRHARRLPRHDNATPQWESQQQNDGLQIRIVPYSPPRISTADSFAPRPHPKHVSDQGHDARQAWTKLGVSEPASPQPSLPAASSARAFATKSPSTSPDLHTSSHFPADFDNASMSSRASSPGHDRASIHSRRSKRVISINSDNKTFSLHPQTATDSSPSSRAGSFGSPQISSTTPSSSWGRVSSNVFLTEDRFSSPSTIYQPSRRYSSSPSASLANYQHQQALHSPTPLSDWNSRMREGVRKVAQTPDSKGKQPAVVSESSDEDAGTEIFTPSEDRAMDTDNGQGGGATTSPQLSAKGSFQTQSSESASTLSERTNYKVYGESSPIRPPTRRTREPPGSVPPSSSHSSANYQILGESSSENQSVSDLPRPPTADSEANYVTFGGPSASCSSFDTNGSRLRSEYSRESLQVAPLRPVKIRKRRSSERSSILKSASRESLRHGSLSSLGSALAMEATRALFARPSPANAGGPSNSPRPDGSATAGYPHEWSRPLSTVMSESEGASLSPTRSASGFSALSMGDRRSSTHSRNLLRIASSMGGLDGQLAGLGDHVGPSLQIPAATYPQNQSWESLNDKAAAYHDEERDGLGDLHGLHHRSSRTRLAGAATDRAIRSSGSTRSLNPFSLPTWARVYYGGGDRRFLIAQASTESIRSLYNGSMYNDPSYTPYNKFLRPSPSSERFNANVHNPRRRPRDAAPELDPYDYAAASTATRPAGISQNPSPPPSRMRSIARGVKKQTSSIWSPHLRRDRRASKFSMWDPPSAVWSTESAFDWRRNQQVVLFVLGFLIPFAWMVAAFLPLPRKPQFEKTERDPRDTTSGPNAAPTFITLEELRYNSARWWRNLNRCMSVFGLLLIGAAIALIVVGVKQQWSA